MKKRCEKCGREFETEIPSHRLCPNCFRSGASSRTGTGTASGGRIRPNWGANFRFDDYLKEGYFRDPAERKQLRTEVVDAIARDIAGVLERSYPETKPYQLRRVFNRLRALERSLRAQHSFEEIQAEITKLKPETFRQVGRKLISEDFRHFIDRNVDLAVQNKDNFVRGFIPHFAAVLGFFEYIKPEK